jgi:hypothetical protein
MVTTPRIRGSFQGYREVREEEDQCSDQMFPLSCLTESPHLRGPFIRTPSITAWPPTGILLDSETDKAAEEKRVVMKRNIRFILFIKEFLYPLEWMST